MPNYFVHDMSTLVTAPLVCITSYYAVDAPTSLILTIAYIFSGYMLSPDLDIPSRIYKRWKWLRFIWKPYQKVIPHRSFLSHSGPFSATIRFIYLFLPLLALLRVLYFVYGTTLPYTVPTFAVVCVWFAMVLSDSLHTFLDYLPFWKGSHGV